MSESSSPKKRIEFIDLAKGFCICLVVLAHVAASYKVSLPLSDFQKAFRMPLYFILSGFFFKTYGGFWDFIKRKTNKLSFLIPSGICWVLPLRFVFSMVLA